MFSKNGPPWIGAFLGIRSGSESETHDVHAFRAVFSPAFAFGRDVKTGAGPGADGRKMVDSVLHYAYQPDPCGIVI